MELIRLSNEAGKEQRPTTTTRIIAERFGKRHADVLRTLENLECSEEFTQRNFAFSQFLDTSGKSNKEYTVTRDGFMFLVMGFTGKKAATIKEQFIVAFNAMEEKLRNLVPSLDLSQLDPSFQAIFKLAIQQKQQETQLRLVESKLQIAEERFDLQENYSTLAAFLKSKSVVLPPAEVAKLGKIATNLSKEQGVPVNVVPCAKYGKRNIYHVDILNKLKVIKN